MIDRNLKFLNCKEELEKSIPIFKEAFIEYYGEEYRQEIEEKFSKAKFIGYQSIEGLESTIRDFSIIKTSELIQAIIAKHNLDYTEKDLTGGCSFEHKDIQPLNKLLDILENNELGPEGRLEKSMLECLEVAKHYYPEMTIEDMRNISKTGIIPEQYQEFPSWVKNRILYDTVSENVEARHRNRYISCQDLLELISLDITEDNFQEILKRPEFTKYLDLKEDYQNAYKEYQESLKLIENYLIEVEEYKKLKQDLNEKYLSQFIFKNLDILSWENRTKVIDYLKNNTGDYKVKNYIDNIFGMTLNAVIGIESFSSESEKMLNDSSTEEWKISRIKRNRVSFFNSNGIHLGFNYEDYLDNEEVKKIWPSTERIDELLKHRKIYKELCDKDLYDNTERYQETIKEIDDLDLLDKSIRVDKIIYEQGGTFVLPNAKKVNGSYDEFSILAINFNNIMSNHIDHNIVHELNHLLEVHINSVVGNTYDGVCGWDVFSEEDNDDYEDTKRSYELFNEIINELIAQEISAIMHRDNTYVFDDPEDSSYIGVTSYEHTAFLVRTFFEEYKDLIIKSRNNGNISIILDAVGKENFEELNGLFKIYEKEFPESKMFRLSVDLNNNEDTELTRIFYDLVDKRDKILEKMHNYYESHLEEENQL